MTCILAHTYYIGTHKPTNCVVLEDHSPIYLLPFKLKIFPFINKVPFHGEVIWNKGQAPWSPDEVSSPIRQVATNCSDSTSVAY